MEFVLGEVKEFKIYVNHSVLLPLFILFKSKRHEDLFSPQSSLYSVMCRKKDILLLKKIPPTGTNSKPSKSPLIPGKLNCWPIISQVQSSVSKLQQRATVHKILTKKSRTFAGDCSFLSDGKERTTRVNSGSVGASCIKKMLSLLKVIFKPAKHQMEQSLRKK